MGLLLCWMQRAEAHTGVILPWDSDTLDYAQAPPDAWKVLDLHVSVLLGVFLFTWLYFQAITTWRVRYGWSEKPAENWRKVCFVLGQVVLLFSLDGPLHHLADYYLFSAHMVQHLLLNLVWAPLTVVALPGWLVEAALQISLLRKLLIFWGSYRSSFWFTTGFSISGISPICTIWRLQTIMCIL